MDEFKKKKVKELFSDWLDTQDSKKQINASATDIRKDAASILGIKTAKVTKLFNYMKKIYEDGDNELEEISVLIDEIKN